VLAVTGVLSQRGQVLDHRDGGRRSCIEAPCEVDQLAHLGRPAGELSNVGRQLVPRVHPAARHRIRFGPADREPAGRR
jgi:hypothetical protein